MKLSTNKKNHKCFPSSFFFRRKKLEGGKSGRESSQRVSTTCSLNPEWFLFCSRPSLKITKQRESVWTDHNYISCFQSRTRRKDVTSLCRHLETYLIIKINDSHSWDQKTNSVEKACFIFLKWESWWREEMFFEDWRRLSMFKTIDNRSFKAGLTTKLAVLICCSGRVDDLILIHFCTLCRHVMKKTAPQDSKSLQALSGSKSGYGCDAYSSAKKRKPSALNPLVSFCSSPHIFRFCV